MTDYPDRTPTQAIFRMFFAWVFGWLAVCLVRAGISSSGE